jgi:hypothetical protein
MKYSRQFDSLHFGYSHSIIEHDYEKETANTQDRNIVSLHWSPLRDVL